MSESKQRTSKISKITDNVDFTRLYPDSLTQA
jgi:hypothetical protein